MHKNTLIKYIKLVINIYNYPYLIDIAGRASPAEVDNNSTPLLQRSVERSGAWHGILGTSRNVSKRNDVGSVSRRPLPAVFRKELLKL